MSTAKVNSIGCEVLISLDTPLEIVVLKEIATSQWLADKLYKEGSKQHEVMQKILDQINKAMV